MKRYIIITILVLFADFLKAQVFPQLELAKDSIRQHLLLDKSSLDSLVENLSSIEEEKLDLFKDTLLSKKERHERTVRLNLSREGVLRRWLVAERYTLWKTLYKGRLDPVALAWKGRYTY